MGKKRETRKAAICKLESEIREDKKTHGRKKKRRRNFFARMRLWQKVLFIIVLIIVILFGCTAAFAASKWSMVESDDLDAEEIVINADAEVNLGDGYTNIAIFGVDSRDGLTDSGTRSDMIMVLSLNNETKEIRIVSVYRDTLLNLSEGTYQKCNAAYSYGGATMAISMLNMNLDLDITDYVAVDFSAVSDVIDILGGVEIEITEEELPSFNKYVTETAEVSGKEANTIEEAGTYLMDGVQAVTYARIRSTEGGDFTRTERQRLVFEKIFEKIKDADVATLNDVVNEILPEVSTSLSLKEVLLYASAYADYELGEMSGFPFETGDAKITGLGSIVYPVDSLTENVSELHEFLFDKEDYTPSSTVEEISGTINSYLY